MSGSKKIVLNLYNMFWHIFLDKARVVFDKTQLIWSIKVNQEIMYVKAFEFIDHFRCVWQQTCCSQLYITSFDTYFYTKHELFLTKHKLFLTLTKRTQRKFLLTKQKLFRTKKKSWLTFILQTSPLALNRNMYQN